MLNMNRKSLYTTTPAYKNRLLYSSNSACPHANNAVLAAFSKIPVLDAYMLDNRRRGVLASASTTVPMVAIGLVVYLGHALAGRAHDAPRVKHHTGDWVVVSKGVVDGSGAKIPYLLQI